MAKIMEKVKNFFSGKVMFKPKGSAKKEEFAAKPEEQKSEQKQEEQKQQPSA